MRRWLGYSVGALALASAVLLAACGGGGGGKEGTTPPANASSVNVSLKEFTITTTPALSIQPGETVRFQVKNDGTFVHGLEVEGQDVEKEIEGNVPVGQTKELVVKFSKAGSYELYCPVDGHRGRGMTLKVQVSSGSSSSQQGVPSPVKSGQSDGGVGY